MEDSLKLLETSEGYKNTLYEDIASDFLKTHLKALSLKYDVLEMCVKAIDRASAIKDTANEDEIAEKLAE